MNGEIIRKKIEDRGRYAASCGGDKGQYSCGTKGNVFCLLLSPFISFCLLFLCSSVVLAQVSGTNSTYSRFGLGVLHDQSQGFNKSMGGVGLGVRMGNRINTMNPASYSSIDSLSLILDVGMSGSFGKMKQESQSVKVKNASLDYVHFGMRLAKGLGLSVGFVPYSSIDYDFTSPETTIAQDPNTSQAITCSTVYAGSGGLNQAYIGLGWKAYKDFSIGLNAAFVWGKYEHLLTPIYEVGGTSSSNFSSVIKNYEASLRTYKLDLGVQYPFRLTQQDRLTLGATVGFGHKIAQDAQLTIYSYMGDSTSFKASSPFDLPYTFAFGAAWQHSNTLLVAADMHYECWGRCRMPVETTNAYVPTKGYYKNMAKIAIGTQWTPAPYDKRYWKRVQYRAGFNYTTPYLMVNGKTGPKEISVTAGAGLPITNRINNRSVVNFGLQWLRRSASGAGMVKEDYLVINLGMTFNERWFMKYKIE